MQTELTIEGMNCNHCVNAVRNALQSIPGVNRVEVTLTPGQARVEHGPAVDPQALIAAVDEEGYRARVL